MRMLHGLFLCPVVCLAQAAVPVISFSKTHHDFGRVLQGNKVSYNYEVTNKGNAPLQIREVRPSCGCTYTMVSQRLLKPGESTFIEAQFDSAGMMGTIHKFLDVVSDDPAYPSLQLTFEANVIREIMPSTSVVVFNEIQRNGSALATIRLESGSGQPVVVTDASFPNAPYLTCNPQKEGNDVILNVSIDGQLIPKENNRGVNILTVRTANSKIPVLQFNIQWDVRVSIIASHNRIIWTGAHGKEYRTTITLRHTDDEPFRILDAESTSSLVKTVGLSKDRASVHKFDVVLSAEAKTGGYRELLTLKLDDPKQNELEIAIAVALR